MSRKLWIKQTVAKGPFTDVSDWEFLDQETDLETAEAMLVRYGKAFGSGFVFEIREGIKDYIDNESDEQEKIPDIFEMETTWNVIHKNS